MVAELVVENDAEYFLKGLSPALDLKYTVSYQTITQEIHSLNSALQHPLVTVRPSEVEVRWQVERGMMIIGRAIKIMTGTSTGRATRNENPQAHILSYEFDLMPCTGVILNWFMPGALPGIETQNIAFLIALQRGAPVLLEVTKFHYLMGEILEGKYANIKQHQHIRL